MRPPEREDEIDALYADLLRIGESAADIRDWLANHDSLTDNTLLALLRRAVPQKLLEHIATTRPWSERVMLLGAVAMNPRVPRPLALRILSELTWMELASLAATPRVDAAVRWRSEEILRDRLPDMRLGERIALARIATSRVLLRILLDNDPKVIEAALLNSRLREDDVLSLIRADTPPRTLCERVPECYRWQESHAIRLSLVLQVRTPLSLALAQLSHLQDADLSLVAAMPAVSSLLRAGAERVLEQRRRAGPGRLMSE